jgi:hypothetical protein
MFDHGPAGVGGLGFCAIAEAGGDAVEWLAAALDEYEGELFVGIRRSYACLTECGLGEGKV